MITRSQFNSDFDNFVESMKEILINKNHDYTAESADPLFNFKRAEHMGVPAWKGALVRFSDKVSRLETFAKKEAYKVSDENFFDTLRDGANYLFLVGELYKEYKNDKDNQTNKNRNRPTGSVEQATATDSQ